MSASFHVVTFCTPGYKDLAKRLAKSCGKFSLTVFVHEMEDKGSWEENCNMKPSVILGHLWHDHSVLFLDADAEMMRYPALLQETAAEFAIVDRPTLGFGSGTCYFGPRSLHLVALWAELALREPKVWDQKLLQKAWMILNNNHAAPETLFLPDSYLRKVGQPGDTVILHHQASRTRKKKR